MDVLFLLSCYFGAPLLWSIHRRYLQLILLSLAVGVANLESGVNPYTLTLRPKGAAAYKEHASQHVPLLF